MKHSLVFLLWLTINIVLFDWSGLIFIQLLHLCLILSLGFWSTKTYIPGLGLLDMLQIQCLIIYCNSWWNSYMIYIYYEMRITLLLYLCSLLLCDRFKIIYIYDVIILWKRTTMYIWHMVVIVWWLDFQLPVQAVAITTNVVNSNLAQKKPPIGQC
jgi:hypothetical protein